MHESALARSLVHTINAVATKQDALGVVAARIRLGSFSGMSEEKLRKQFTGAARGTRAEGAVLKVHRIGSDGGVVDSEHSQDASYAAHDEYEADRGVILESIELRLELSAAL